MASVIRRSVFHMTKGKFLLIRKKSTEVNILKSIHKDIIIRHKTIGELAWQNLERWPDKTLVISAETGRRYTYGETYKMSITFAASLRSKLRLQDDDKVAIILPNVPEYPCVVLGILEAGGVASMMNPAYTVQEFKHQLELIDCKAIVSSKLSYHNIMAALKEMKSNIPVILIDDNNLPDGTIKFSEFSLDLTIDTDCLKSVNRKENDVAILPFSSGTTGFPKGVVLTHKNVVADSEMMYEPDLMDFEEANGSYQSVVPAVLPFFHIYGFNSLVGTMGRGVKLVTMPKFNPKLFVDCIFKYKVENLNLVPAMAIFLGRSPEVTRKHLESVRSVICGGSAIHADDVLAFLEKNKNINFRQVYGLTETSGAVSLNCKTDSNYTSVGHLCPSSEVKIADINTLEALGPGEEGEIWYRGPNVMSGYYKNEEATKEVLKDGWFRTGDIGKYDENKYLYLTDRLKELIKVKGFQVPPAELEMIIRSHPKVQDCAVLGIPDPVKGEVPKAFVISEPGADLKAEEILEFVNSQVVSFKKIKEVQFVDGLPRNSMGKILRKELKKIHC